MTQFLAFSCHQLKKHIQKQAKVEKHKIRIMPKVVDVL